LVTPDETPSFLSVPEEDQDRVVPDSWIVACKEEVASPQQTAEALVTSNGGDVRHVYRHALKGFLASMSAETAEAVSRDPDVRWVVPDTRGEPDHVQDPAPWHLDRIDERSLPLNGRYNYFWGGEGVNLYIVDSGIAANHPEFGNRVMPGFTAINDGHGTHDCGSHGTQVAGVVGGSTGGVAKNVWLWPVRVLDCQPVWTQGWVAAGLDWIAGNHVTPAVVNLSLSLPISGSCGSTFNPFGMHLHCLTEIMVKNLVNQGVAVVTSAGNSQNSDFSGNNACEFTPNRLSQVITVAATDSLDRRAKWQTSLPTQNWSSNWGACVDIWAPGRSISLAHPFGGFVTWHGTSFASPAVAGALALFLEENPARTPSQLQFMVQFLSTSTSIDDAGAGSPHRLLFAPNFQIHIGGPSQIHESGQYQWHAVPHGGGHHQPDTYLWEYRPVSSQSWQAVSSSQTYSRYVTPADWSFELRLTAHIGDVSDGDGRLVEVGPPPCDPQDPLCPW
jgi:subtilisin family serine protease